MVLVVPLAVSGVEPNYEDLDLVVDQARGEKVDVSQLMTWSARVCVWGGVRWVDTSKGGGTPFLPWG